MKRYRLAVCKGPDCRANGGDKVLQAAKAEVSAKGLVARCEIYRGGCYGLCHQGPNVVVREEVGRVRDPLSREDFQLMGWPEEVYYARMTVEGVARVVAEHVGQDCAVQSLRGVPDEQENGPRG
jgi:(2Fe-2S) ferredoxin